MDRIGIDLSIIPSQRGSRSFLVRLHNTRYTPNLDVELGDYLIDDYFEGLDECAEGDNPGEWTMAVLDLVVQKLERLYDTHPIATRTANAQDLRASETLTPNE